MVLLEEQFPYLVLTDKRVEQCRRFCGSELKMGDPKKETRRKPRVLPLFYWILSSLFTLRLHSSQRHISFSNFRLFKLQSLHFTPDGSHFTLTLHTSRSVISFTRQSVHLSLHTYFVLRPHTSIIHTLQQ